MKAMHRTRCGDRAWNFHAFSMYPLQHFYMFTNPEDTFITLSTWEITRDFGSCEPGAKGIRLTKYIFFYNSQYGTGYDYNDH